jgi:hypothetical protein
VKGGFDARSSSLRMRSKIDLAADDVANGDA